MIRAKYPDYKILLTFFSPSGYEVRKHYRGADIVTDDRNLSIHCDKFHRTI